MNNGSTFTVGSGDRLVVGGGSGDRLHVASGGGLVKLGGGTLTLSGVNTFTGPVAVSGGRLVVTSASQLLSSSITIGSAAELQYRGTSALAAPVFTGTTVRVESGGASLVQVNGDYADSLGTHTLVTGLATPGQAYAFLSWTGNSGSLPDGPQSNWTVQEGDTGTKKWGSGSSGSWDTASAWDGFLGAVTADTAAKTLLYELTYVASGTKVPSGGNDVVIDPLQAGLSVTGPASAAAVKSLQVGGGNATSPILALGPGTLSVKQAVTVTSADLTAGAGSVDASVPLAIAGVFKQGSITITAGGMPFKMGGSNLVSQLETIVLQGSMTRIEQTTGGYAAGLDVRSWAGVHGQVQGSRFDISAGNPAGSSTDSTFAGRIGYATQALNMSGSDQAHFGTNSNSGVPNESVRPSGYNNEYTVEYRGKLYEPAAGSYRFATTSDDGSALWISPGDVATANPGYAAAAVQNSNYQGMTTRSSNPISLDEGYHDFIVRFFEGGGAMACRCSGIRPAARIGRQFPASVTSTVARWPRR